MPAGERALELATAYVSLSASGRGLQQDVDAQLRQIDGGKIGNDVGRRFSTGMGGTIKRAAKNIFAPLIAAGVAYKGVDFFKTSLDQASDLNESLNAVNVSYGKNAEGIKKLGREAADSLGLSNNEFNGISVQFSAFAKTIAGDGGNVVGTMEDIARRGSDFASVMNLEVSESLALFQSGLAGETEPLRKYGIDLSAAAVANHAVAEGIAESANEMTEQQKVQARYSLLMKQTANVQGDFANTSDQLANSNRILSANYKNLQARIGAGLLPVAAKLSTWALNQGLPAIEALVEGFSTGESKVGGFAGVLGQIGATSRVVFDEITGGIKAFGAAWKQNDGEITSSGLPGFMELLGYWARQTFDYLKTEGVPAAKDLWETLKQIDLNELSKSFEGLGPKVSAGIDTTSTIFGFLADNIDLVVKAMPALLVAFAGWKTLQAANNLLGRNSTIGMGLQVVSTLSLAASNRALAATQRQVALSQTASNVAGNVGTATQRRMTVSTIASTVAQKAKTAALRAGAIAQRALNLVMRANPIGLIITAIVGLAAVLVTLYKRNETVRRVIDRVWAAMKGSIKTVVDWFTGTAWPWMRDTFSKLGDASRRLRDGVGDAFQGIKNHISNAWDGAKKILDRFKSGLDSLKNRFSSVKDGIGQIWSSIGGVIARPINEVINTINDFLDKLERNINKIPGVNINLPSIPHVPVPSGGGVGGSGRGVQFAADGGVIRGPWKGERADNVLGVSDSGVPVARVNPKEFITRVRSTLSMQRHFPGWLEHINAHGRPPSFAGGGQVGGNLGDTLAGASRWIMDIFRNPGQALRGFADKALKNIGSSWPAQIGLGVTRNAMGDLADWIKDKVFGGQGPEGASGAVGAPMHWSALWDLVKGLFPDAILTSSVRNSTVAGYSHKSLHTLSRAIDFVLSPAKMVDATKLLSRMGRWTELIHTPAGNWQQNRGVNTSNFLPITKRNHHDHVHLGKADGGFVADDGVKLAVGKQIIDNKTGKPEALTRTDKELDISEDTIFAFIRAFEVLMRRNRLEFITDLEQIR